MKLNVKYMLDGGAMPQDPAAAGAPAPAEGAAPAPEQGGADQEQMMQQLAGIAQQIIQELGPEAAAAVFQIGMQMLQEGAGAPQEQPAFQKMGGRLVRVR